MDETRAFRLLEEALAHLACNVMAEHPAGDHTIFLAEVESMEAGKETRCCITWGNIESKPSSGSAARMSV